MKKFIIIILIFCSQIILCPGEGAAYVGLHLGERSEQTETKVAEKKEEQERTWLDHARNLRDHVINLRDKVRKWVTTQSSTHIHKPLLMHDTAQESEETQEDIHKQEREEKLQKTQKESKKRKSVSFAPDVINKSDFNPLNVDTWDLNRLKKITPVDMNKLPLNQAQKLLQKSDYLKKLSIFKLQAIQDNPLLDPMTKEKFENILDNKVKKLNVDTIKKFSLEEIKTFISSTIKAFTSEQIKVFTSGQLEALLNKNELVNALSQEQVQAIDPQALSEALYNKLQQPLSTEFVDKLSDEQIEQLLGDHVEWRSNNWWKNWFTKFKENFNEADLKIIEDKFNYNKALKLLESLGSDSMGPVQWAELAKITSKLDIEAREEILKIFKEKQDEQIQSLQQKVEGIQLGQTDVGKQKVTSFLKIDYAPLMIYKISKAYDKMQVILGLKTQKEIDRMDGVLAEIKKFQNSEINIEQLTEYLKQQNLTKEERQEVAQRYIDQNKARLEVLNQLDRLDQDGLVKSQYDQFFTWNTESRPRDKAVISMAIKNYTNDIENVATQIQLLLDSVQISKLTPAQIAALTPKQIAALTDVQISAFTPDQMDALTIEQLDANEYLKTAHAHDVA